MARDEVWDRFAQELGAGAKEALEATCRSKVMTDWLLKREPVTKYSFSELAVSQSAGYRCAIDMGGVPPRMVVEQLYIPLFQKESLVLGYVSCFWQKNEPQRSLLLTVRPRPA